ncbi:MAG: UDP-N-acetylglucosamine 2-epimerase (non-hydrolyzing) [Chitinophagaceae bacterium]|nr:UDP-N-acetylglucosamine 2-epimerase (non-hydrolyzing) [Chitinophagaceae bacterium]
MNDGDIVFVIGTRPELIKVAPVINAIRAFSYKVTVVSTGQHKELLAPYWKVFGISPDFELDIISPGQDLASLTSRAIIKLNDLIKLFKESGSCPKLILAQGDTTTVMATSIVAFYNQIKFVHLEAGLRSNDLGQPFPEEFNRRVASIATYLHLAPTQIAKNNLVREGINEEFIKIVGNTIVDSLEFIRKSKEFNEGKYKNQILNTLEDDRTVLITCHRRENHGENLRSIILTLEYLININRELKFIWVWHPNPNVKKMIGSSNLLSYQNFLLIEPLDYLDLLRLMNHSSIIITDSGGIQEEAPSFGKPLIVLREVTERPEAIQAGMAKLVGANKQLTISAFDWALHYKPLHFDNPYGDGFASNRIMELLIGSL